MISWFKKKEQEDINFTSVTIGGKKWRYFNDMGQLPTERFYAMRLAVDSYRDEISKDDINKCFVGIIAKINEGDLDGAKTIARYALDYTDLEAKHDQIFDLGNSMILLEDEPIQESLTDWTEKKRVLFKGNKKVRFFFINLAWNYMISVANPSFSDLEELEDYLNQRALRLTERIFLKKIGSISSTPESLNT